MIVLTTAPALDQLRNMQNSGRRILILNFTIDLDDTKIMWPDVTPKKGSERVFPRRYKISCRSSSWVTSISTRENVELCYNF